MRNLKVVTINITVLLFLLFLILPDTTYAYIDLGSGSYIFQMLLAFLLGMSFVLKIYWRKVKVFIIDFFMKRRKDETER